MKKLLKPFIISAVLALVFAYGLGVGHYKWPPFYAIYDLKQTFGKYTDQFQSLDEYKGEQELLQYAFTDPVNEDDLYYSPITTLAGILEANQRIFMHLEGFETSYDDLELVGAGQVSRPAGAQPVVRVVFRYQGRKYEAFAYGTVPTGCAGTGRASLIIPGSGLNQSLGIAKGDPANYHHGILDALDKGGGSIHLSSPTRIFWPGMMEKGAS